MSKRDRHLRDYPSQVWWRPRPWSSSQ